MGIKYREDKDLAFLHDCDEGDLANLARTLTHDTDGQPRRSSELLKHPGFALSAEPGRHQKSWQLIAGELQLFGGDSILNTVRRSGILYEEIARDVCGKLGIKHRKRPTPALEEAILLAVLTKSWPMLSPDESQALREALSMQDVPPDQVLRKLQATMANSEKGFLVAMTVVASISTAQLSKMGLSTSVAGFAGARLIATTAAFPLGAIALTALSAIPALSGAAYRVTVPATIHIGYMRRKYAARNQF